ncbi:MAG: carboxypeptidase regulatory-like domain-containing protein [Acidobacteria bacterium ACB1]|nr:hypothetical protein [Pyrinomonadaceae bacterium]MCE7963525.1 carboxypeptidase regulatory-like domain-containing protein [Acidobacteria bacterium ACB1]RIJ90188.1 MAG: hypothetical protein DCC44_10875 [Acidobacteriota bacterium]
MKKIMRYLGLALILLAFVAQISLGQSGTYEIRRSVIAGGGRDIDGGSYRIRGTIGQSSADSFFGPGNYEMTAGFWAPPLTPTAASASISGRVRTQNGQGIPSASVTLTDSAGNVKQVVSSSFGYYIFTDVEVGVSYVLDATARGHTITGQARIVSVYDNVTGADIIADEPQ